MRTNRGNESASVPHVDRLGTDASDAVGLVCYIALTNSPGIGHAAIRGHVVSHLAHVLTQHVNFAFAFCFGALFQSTDPISISKSEGELARGWLSKLTCADLFHVLLGRIST